MAALTADRIQTLKQFKSLNFAAAADTYYQGALVGIDTADGLLKVGQAGLLTWVPVGFVTEQVVAALNDLVNVRLLKPIEAAWLANSADDAVDAADLLKPCYVEDDQTVSETGNAGADAVAGIVWAVDSTKGVLVEITPLISILDQRDADTV